MPHFLDLGIKGAFCCHYAESDLVKWCVFQRNNKGDFMYVPVYVVQHSRQAIVVCELKWLIF